MVIAHVISSDIVMTAWGVQNVAVNIAVGGGGREKPSPIILNAPPRHGRDADRLQTPSAFLGSSWKLPGVQAGPIQTGETVSLYAAALPFLRPFPYFFSFLKGQVSKIPKRGEAGVFFPACLGCFCSRWGGAAPTRPRARS